MNRLKQSLVAVIIIIGGVLLTPPSALAQAVDVCGVENADTAYCKNQDNDVSSIIRAVVNLLLMAVAIISVIVIIVGGIFFALANGDSAKVAKARNTVLYAVIGLVVSLFSYAIVQFVFNRVNQPADSSGGTSYFSA